MSSLKLRAAGLDDVEPLLEFWRLAAEGTDRVDSADGVRALLTRDPLAVLLADDAGTIVGSLIAGWDGWRAHLYRLAVHPQRRRLGLGAASLAEAEHRFAALGARRVDAMVLDDNELGGKAWVALGYAPQPEWSRWVKYLPPGAR